jgi:fatty acid-binding protein DegV
MNGVIKKYVEKLAQLTEESGIQHVRFCHSRNEKGVEKLKKALSEAGIEYIDEGTCLCGAIVATHLGVGALGFGALPDKF